MGESDYPLSRLGDALQLDIETVPVEGTATYQIAGVYGFGRGLFGRGPLNGTETTYKSFHRLRENQIVLSQLKGWEGAIARVTRQFDGWYLSPQFPTFSVNEEKADIGFIEWFCKLSRVWDELRSAARGMGARRDTVPPDRFLDLPIPLPPIAEQRRIVSKIEFIATKVDEARQLRQAIQTDMDSLVVAMAHRNDLSEEEKAKQGWERVALGEVLTQVSDPVEVEPGGEYPHFGIYSFAKGLFKKAPLLGDDIKAAKLYRVREGQFIYGRLNAYEGAFAVIDADYDGGHVSNEFPTFECDAERILPEFLLAYFSTPAVWEALKRKVTGIGGGAGNRRIRLKESILLADGIWLPPMGWQRKIKSIAEKLGASKPDREAAELELDALLPAILDRAFKGKL